MTSTFYLTVLVYKLPSFFLSLLYDTQPRLDPFLSLSRTTTLPTHMSATKDFTPPSFLLNEQMCNDKPCVRVYMGSWVCAGLLMCITYIDATNTRSRAQERTHPLCSILPVPLFSRPCRHERQ